MAKSPAKQNPVMTGIEMLAGATPPVNLDLKIQFTAQHDPKEQHSLPAPLAEALLSQQDVLLRWLNANRSHQMSFLTDPVGSLQKAGVKLPAGGAEALLSLHAMKKPADVLPPGVTLSSVTTEMGKSAAPKEKKSADQEHAKAERPRGKRR